MYPRAHLHNQLQAEKFSFFHVLNMKCESVSVNGHKATFSAFQTSPTTPCRTTGLRSSRTGATALQLFLFHSLTSAWPVESTSGACSPFPYISLWSVPKKKLTKGLAFLSFSVQAWWCQNKQTNKQTTYWDEMTWLFSFVLHHWNVWKWIQARIVGVTFSFFFWYEKIPGLRFLNEEKKTEKKERCWRIEKYRIAHWNTHVYFHWL